MVSTHFTSSPSIRYSSFLHHVFVSPRQFVLRNQNIEPKDSCHGNCAKENRGFSSLRPLKKGNCMCDMCYKKFICENCVYQNFKCIVCFDYRNFKLVYTILITLMGSCNLNQTFWSCDVGMQVAYANYRLESSYCNQTVPMNYNVIICYQDESQLTGPFKNNAASIIVPFSQSGKRLGTWRNSFQA